MTKELQKHALATIWALVYRSSQQDLDLRQIQELEAALAATTNGLAGDDYFNRCVMELRGAVRTLGIVSIPYRRPKQTEGIMAECNRLQNYLDE